MLEEGWKYLSVYFSSMFKFAGGPLFGYASGLSLQETIILTILGMMTSVLIFSYLGQAIKNRFFKKRKRKLFTKRNRRIVLIWKKYGLFGIAFLTPIILSPIVGTTVAAAFGERPRRIVLFMLVSAIFWGITLTAIFFQIGHLKIFN